MEIDYLLLCNYEDVHVLFPARRLDCLTRLGDCFLPPPFSIRIMATADGGAYRQVTLDL
jgi:hypothetical protein